MGLLKDRRPRARRRVAHTVRLLRARPRDTSINPPWKARPVRRRSTNPPWNTARLCSTNPPWSTARPCTSRRWKEQPPEQFAPPRRGRSRRRPAAVVPQARDAHRLGAARPDPARADRLRRDPSCSATARAPAPPPSTTSTSTTTTTTTEPTSTTTTEPSPPPRSPPPRRPPAPRLRRPTRPGASRPARSRRSNRPTGQTCRRCRRQSRFPADPRSRCRTCPDPGHRSATGPRGGDSPIAAATSIGGRDKVRPA